VAKVIEAREQREQVKTEGQLKTIRDALKVVPDQSEEKEESTVVLD
jgi:hypothetical protein